MRHHTKDKGDEGLGFVIADLLQAKIQVALPISEHLPFDCIAISEDNQLCRLSVKYRKVEQGSLRVVLRSTWADKHGSHVREHDKASYDATAIYCPDTKACYYVRNSEVDKRITLRVEPLRVDYKTTRVRFAGEYSNPIRLFRPSS